MIEKLAYRNEMTGDTIGLEGIKKLSEALMINTTLLSLDLNSD